MSIVRAKAAGGPKALTREHAADALREYAEMYGADFTTAAFNPSVARWRDQPELVDRYYAGRPDGRPWPSLNSIKKVFGGNWNAARRAAGLPENRPGPRRDGGLHGPIRDLRIQRVVVRSGRADDEKLHRRLNRAEAKAARLEAELADRPVVVKTVTQKAPKPQTKTITKTKTVTKRDERALERLRGQVADERTRRVASDDQAKAAVRDRDKARREVEKMRLSLDASALEAKEARDEANRMADRLAAAESRVERLRDDLDEMTEMQARADGDARHRAAIAEQVRRAEMRADQAEMRAARAEREMAEQVQAITGERRKLTAAEMAELRRQGPAGPKVLGDALKSLARARAGRGRLAEALTDVASAALMWRDRVR